MEVRLRLHERKRSTVWAASRVVTSSLVTWQKTGDGILTNLLYYGGVLQSRARSSEETRPLHYPQQLVNVRVTDKATEVS